MLDRDYVNSDMDGYAFKLNRGDRPIVEIIGFDFEYYQKDPQEAERIKLNIQQSVQSGNSAKTKVSRVFRYRPIVIAAYYGMNGQMGVELPPKNRVNLLIRYLLEGNYFCCLWLLLTE